jgi:Flp pilus assembly protein TadG
MERMKRTDKPGGTFRSGANASSWRCAAASIHLSRQGNAAVEFALLSPLLLIMLTGVVEIGMAGYQAMQVQASVEAGVLYVAQNGAGNLTAIGQAVVNATGTTGIAATPVPVAYCGCPTTAGIVSQTSNCTSVCPDGTAPGHYVQINAALAHSTIMPFLTLPLPATLTASSTIRVQ